MSALCVRAEEPRDAAAVRAVNQAAFGASAEADLVDALRNPHVGFVPGSRYGLRSEYDVPDDVFMACEVTAGALAGASGLVRYNGAFVNV